jgi:hypothetical protein
MCMETFQFKCKKTIIFTDLKRLTLIQEPVELEKVILQFKHMKTLS